jgi:hypothetical protein
MIPGLCANNFDGFVKSQISWFFVIPVNEACHNWQNHEYCCFCHSGLDKACPALDAGESIVYSEAYATGCRIRSGMTIKGLFRSSSIFVTTPTVNREPLNREPV